MRLKSVNGSIETVVKVVAAVECRHNFNGTKRRLFETCKDSSIQPNALVFTFENNMQPMCTPFGVGNEDRLVLGNLTVEQVGEITDALLTKGYFDISGLKLQKHEMTFEKYKVDEGKSGAYAYATNCVNNIFTNAMFCGNGVFVPNEFPADNEENSDGDEFGEDC